MNELINNPNFQSLSVEEKKYNINVLLATKVHTMEQVCIILSYRDNLK